VIKTLFAKSENGT
jgi:hypothetical protein